jgi:hypothetical protein
MTVYAFAVHGKIKIGYSGQIENRLAHHRRQHGKIKILALLRGDRDLERSLHSDFAEHCIGGEWFRDCQQIRSALEMAVALQPSPKPAAPEQYGPFLNYEQTQEIKKRREDGYFTFAYQSRDRRRGAKEAISALPLSLREMQKASDCTVEYYFLRLVAAHADDESGCEPERAELAAIIARNDLLRENLLTCHAHQRALKIGRAAIAADE